MRWYCGPVEFVVRTAEEWRDMDEATFERNLAVFTEQLRAYHARNAEHRKRFRMVRWSMVMA